jgi:hypothetical protein
MLRIVQILAIAMLCLDSSPADARIPSIPGWSYSQSESGVVISTPCGGGSDIVAYGIYPAYASNANSKAAWFSGQVNFLIGGWTGARPANAQFSAVAQEGAVMYQTLEFDSEPGKRWSALVLGTFVGRLGQLYAIVTPTSTDESDPRLQAAVAHAMTSIRANFTLAPQSLKQVPQGIAPQAAFSGSPMLTLMTSQLRSFASHRIDPQPRQLIITSSGRFFEAQVSDYVAQGKFVMNAALGAYEVTYGDGSFDVIPASCATTTGVPAGTPAPPLQTPPATRPAAARPTPAIAPSTGPAPGPAPGRNCRKATKEVFTQRTMQQCDFRGVCTLGPVSTVHIEETDEIICD